MTKIRLLSLISSIFILILFNNANSQTWEQTSAPDDVSILSLAINSSGHIFAGTHGNGICRSTDNGDTWTYINAYLTNRTVHTIAINSSDHIFAGTSGGIFRSTNNGDTWTEINNGMTSPAVFSFAFNSSGTIFAATSYYVFVSTDNGDNWTMANYLMAGAVINAIAANSTNTIFAGALTGVSRTSNNGDTWTILNTDLDFWALAINSFDHIFAGTMGQGLYRSTNNGDDWLPINSGLTSNLIYAIAFGPSGDIFVGTYEGGIFHSENNGSNWTAINDGLTDTNILSIAVNASGDAFAGSYDGGIFRLLSQTDVSVKNDLESIPSEYSISQNYPNPFNPATNIIFDLPRASFVKLNVYNLLGKKVETLISKKMEAGSHTATWNGTDMASGIYFYQIETENFSETKKMLLLK